MTLFPQREVLPVSTEMEAVTIISPGYEDVGNEAVKRFSKFARCKGLPIRVHVRHEPVSGHQVFARKLDMDGFAGKTILFFDADWILLRPVDFGDYVARDQFIGVRDHGNQIAGCFPKDDCEKFHLPKETYINGGFLIFDADKHRHVWQHARELMAGGGMHDHGEQSYLNRAIHLLQVPVLTLPIQFNFWKFLVDWGGFPFIPRGIIGLHGAGIAPAQKLSALLQQAAVFETPQAPICFEEWQKINTSNFIHTPHLL